MIEKKTLQRSCWMFSSARWQSERWRTPLHQCASVLSFLCALVFKATVKRLTEMCNLFCNIAAKRVRKRCYAFNHPRPNLSCTQASSRYPSYQRRLGTECEFSRQAWQVTSHPKSPRTTWNEAGTTRLLQQPKKVLTQIIRPHPFQLPWQFICFLFTALVDPGWKLSPLWETRPLILALVNIFIITEENLLKFPHSFYFLFKCCFHDTLISPDEEVNLLDIS